MEIIEAKHDFKAGRARYIERIDFFGNPLPKDLDDFFYTGILFDINVRTNDPITGRKTEKNLEELTDEDWNGLFKMYTIYTMDHFLNLVDLVKKLLKIENIGVLREEENLNSYLNFKIKSAQHNPSILNISGKVFQDRERTLDKMRESLKGIILPYSGIEYRVANLENPRIIACHDSQTKGTSPLGNKEQSKIFTPETYRLFVVNGMVKRDDFARLKDEDIKTRPVNLVVMPRYYFYEGHQKPVFTIEYDVKKL